MEKPYHLSRQFAAVKNASQEEEANVGVMWLEDWPGLQLLFSITMTQKQQHYWILDKMDVRPLERFRLSFAPAHPRTSDF
jgi:hypothetical protein